MCKEVAPFYFLDLCNIVKEDFHFSCLLEDLHTTLGSHEHLPTSLFKRHMLSRPVQVRAHSKDRCQFTTVPGAQTRTGTESKCLEMLIAIQHCCDIFIVFYKTISI